jgi:hypothetical protein
MFVSSTSAFRFGEFASRNLRRLVVLIL